jgi:hypothetical protein
MRNSNPLVPGIAGIPGSIAETSSGVNGVGVR